MLQHLERYIQQSRVVTDQTKSDTRELIFLVLCAVLASRKVLECDPQDVDRLVQKWYRQPAIAA